MMENMPPLDEMALLGHSNWQAPHPVQFSAMILNAMMSSSS
jgi:hypothetical protein